MTITERFTALRTAIGLPAIIAIVFVALVLIWFAFGGLSNAWDSYVSNKEIERLKKEADSLRQQAAQADIEKEQYKGAAAAYKEQADTVTNELTNLQAKRPELTKSIESAKQKVEAVRNRPERPITNDMRERVDELGAKLDKLYPN